MLSDGELERAASQLDDYNKRNTLADILDGYRVLLEDYRRLKSDFEEERDAREKYKRTVRDHERNPFVLVLVDGDGYVFDDAVVAKRGEGGSDAAQRLNDEIQASLRQKGKGLEHCQIMIRVYANVAGLSKALAAVGLVGFESRSLAPFIASFNRTYDLTEFVDAGQLKENADSKLRGMLRLYANSAQCKHIYFAGCHDVGYISELTPYLSNADKFTLVNTPGIRFHEEFAKLGMKIGNISGVFRSTPLDTAKSYRAAAAAAGAIAAAPASPTKSSAASPDDKKAICSFYLNGTCKFGKGCKRLHVDDRTDAKQQSWNDAPSELQSEAGGVSLRPTPTLLANNDRSPRSATSPISSLPRKADILKGHIALNSNNYRLDPYIEELDLDVIAQLRARIGHKRVCNSFHLTGHCKEGDNCQYDHTPVEGATLLALEALARSQPCPKKGACRKLGCTNGHVCQIRECKHRGGRLYCRIGYPSHFEDFVAAKYVPGVARGMERANGLGSLKTRSISAKRYQILK
ncbi:hypothetical protein B0T16DRAFT_429320 [Cercophora newfieldiana]|uniref:C3H1-type domain-containing protein n=1 Tax=Cercophora newfieldiana TaxID=92897 RepID=A0AA39Y7V9_9PEZI|nr:hypothetical protein B0T16DRAFT_429320 [Cercophora newfieldiana]